MNYIFFLIFILLTEYSTSDENYCNLASSTCKNDKLQSNRYLFYDVNPPEGFNARRDVYMRFAILTHKLVKLKRLSNFKLILPPWSFMVHWGYKEKPEHYPWNRFFDVNSMKLFAPVMEMYEFFEEVPRTYKKINIEAVYVLQHFEDMFESGKFEDKIEICKCQRTPNLNYYFYANITSNNVKCLSFHGAATNLIQFIANTTAKSILFDHGEVALHEYFGNKLYWQCRRSMRFNKELKNFAADFRKIFLNSSDVEDNTILPEDWRDETPYRNAKGGPYLSIHLRRKDFLRSRSDQIPTVDNIVHQIKNYLNKLSLKKIFIATDDDKSVFNTLQKRLPSDVQLFQFKSKNNKFNEGENAIIDQIICSHARYFVGTQESTFTFRIQEEREIMGFPVDSTFNVFCRNDKKCPKPSIWKIVH